MSSDPHRDLATTAEVTINLSIEELARLFCELGSDDQARFLVLVGDGLRRWTSLATETQWTYVGQALHSLGSSANSARRMIDTLSGAINPGGAP